MAKNLYYITFIFITLFTLGNTLNKCTEGEDGFVYCEDISSQGQQFLIKRNEDVPVLLKRDDSNTCLNASNDNIYGLVQGFDIFCFDEITSASSFSITGRVAAKNRIDANSVTLNGSGKSDCSQNPFKFAVYTDKFKFNNGQINGGIHYGSSLDIPSYMYDDFERRGCQLSNDRTEGIDFDVVEERITEISENLAELESNAEVEVYQNPNIRIVLKKNIKNYVIDVNENTFNKNGGYEFSVDNSANLNPEEVTILFNVKSSTITFTNAGFKWNGFEERIIWNMPETTTVNISSVALNGLIIAPKAEVNFQGGDLHGKFISKKFNCSSVSINNNNFNGCIPRVNTRESIEEPEIVGPYRNETVCNDVNVKSREINSDIVFIFDESVSMCSYIEAMRAKLQEFINQLDEANANARFAVVGFGGKPRIYTPFTSKVEEVKSAFNKLNCKQGGQESGLEAIRMFLNKSNKFLNKDNKSFNYDVEKLAWRSDSSKTIILVTDEDSDLPHYAENRNDLQLRNLQYVVYTYQLSEKELTESIADYYIGFPYYLNNKSYTYNDYYIKNYADSIFFEPAFTPAVLTTDRSGKNFNFYRSGSPLRLTEPYQKEVDETAKLIIKENIQLFMLLNDDLAASQGASVANSQYDKKNPYFVKYNKKDSDDSSTITAQYGNPFLDNVSSEKYERESILKKLVERHQEKSLQGQILKSKGFCRAFNMKDFVKENSEKMVESFYKTVVTTVQSCTVIKVPIENEEESDPDSEPEANDVSEPVIAEKETDTESSEEDMEEASESSTPEVVVNGDEDDVEDSEKEDSEPDSDEDIKTTSIPFEEDEVETTTTPTTTTVNEEETPTTTSIIDDEVEIAKEPTRTPSPEIEWPTGPYRNITVCSDDEVQTRIINSDIVFIIDESASMCKYIDAMRNKLNNFIVALDKADANARFAIIGFGGEPRIYSSFTDDVESVKNAFGKLNCSQGGQESGLEAIRMFLKKSNKFIDRISRNSGGNKFSNINELAWRHGSTKTIILVTDEDSDLPHYEENRNSLQIANTNNYFDIQRLSDIVVDNDDIKNLIGYPYYYTQKNYQAPEYSDEVFFEPSFSPAILTSVNGIRNFYRSSSPLVLSPSYQKEVDDTAELIISENIQLFMLLNDDLADSQGKDVANSQFNEKNPYWLRKGLESDDSSTITAQYGNPLLDSFTNVDFEREEIYKKLADRSQEKSLQGQILAKEGFCRAFNMKEFTSGQSEKMVDLFYETVVNTVKNCKVIPVPIEEPTTTEYEEETETVTTTTTPSPEIEWPTGPYRNITVCEDEEYESKEIDSDIVFIIDESASMCKYVDPMKEKLNDLVDELKKAKANARIAVIGFGGKPRIYSAFTDDFKVIEKAFENLDCKDSGQESGLEAIRMFLNKSKKFVNKINNKNGESNYENVEDLEWREDSTRTIILVTDEDSDLPYYEENRNNLQIENVKGSVDIKSLDGKEVDSAAVEKFMGFPYYLNKAYMPQYNTENYFEPSFSPAILTSVNGVYTFYRTGSPLVLSPSFQKEVVETAELISRNNVQLFMLINDNLADAQGADVANSQLNENNPYWK